MSDTDGSGEGGGVIWLDLTVRVIVSVQIVYEVRRERWRYGERVVIEARMQRENKYVRTFQGI